jgi:hypothetical protein
MGRSFAGMMMMTTMTLLTLAPQFYECHIRNVISKR